jgi:hypothetical protein
VVDRPLVRRRTAVAGALGGLAVAVLAAGCDHGDDLAPPQADSSSATATPSSQASDQTPDEALVDEVLGRLTHAVLVLTHARKAPQVGKAFVPLIVAHRRHISVLEGDLPDKAPPGPPPDPAASLHTVRRSEHQLQAALADAAVRAESGALARLLASMSASVTQYVAVLPRSLDA